MKIIKMTVACISLLFVATALFAQSGPKEQLNIPLTDPGKPYKLDVAVMSGAIKLVGYEGKEVVIDAQLDTTRNRGYNEGTNPNINVNITTDVRMDRKGNDMSKGMKQIKGLSGIDITATENNNTITVRSGSMSGIINLVIKVPYSSTLVKLATINNGDINVTGISGKFEISNVSGSIKLKDISGSVVASTVSGSVTVTFKTIDAKAAMSFVTLTGNVDVTFPAGLKANVKLKSDMGLMFTDFEIDTEKSESKINKTVQQGMYRLNIDDWVYGKIDGGGPEIMMKNMTGNIYIRKLK